MKLFWSVGIILAIYYYCYIYSPTFSSGVQSQRIQEWRSKGRYFLFESQNATHSIFYIDEKTSSGNNNVLLVLHGFPTSSADFIDIWPSLCLKFGRIVTLDFIGFGFSDKPRGDYKYSIIEQALITQSLLKELRLLRVHILAHDYGVSIAQEMLSRYERGMGVEILSICFLNGGLFSEAYKPILIQKFLINSLTGPIISKLSIYSIFENSMRKLFGPKTQPTEAQIEEFWNIIQFNNGNTNTEKVIQYMEERPVYRDRWVKAMQETKVPMILITGPYDSISGRNIAERYKEIIPNANVVYLADHISHYPQIEAPDQVMTAYSLFLQSLSK